MNSEAGTVVVLQPAPDQKTLPITGYISSRSFIALISVELIHTRYRAGVNNGESSRKKICWFFAGRRRRI